MIRERIRKYRTKRELTQEQLAIRAGITYATLVKLESGANRNPTLKTLRLLSRALGISIHSLIP